MKYFKKKGRYLKRCKRDEEAGKTARLMIIKLTKHETEARRSKSYMDFIRRKNLGLEPKFFYYIHIRLLLYQVSCSTH